MKKIIPLFLILVTLFGCSAKTYTPVIDTAFSINAVYKTGDFSYFCKIDSCDNSISITPTTTYAEGMTITYDGKNVNFKKGNFSKSIDGDKIDSTNPAKILYEVFNYLDTSKVKRVGDTFQYTGKTSVGNFVLIQNDDNSLKSLSIPDAGITITFQK